MTRLNKAASLAAIVVVSFVGFGACSDDPAGAGGGNESLSDPDVFETEMRAKFLPAALGIIDGFERLLVALNGGAQDGVTLVPNGTGGLDVGLTVDLDGNGSKESVINGGSTGSVGTGASVGVTDIMVPATPSLTASSSATLTQTSPTSIVMDNMSGSLSVDEPGSMNASTTTIVSGSVGLDLASGNPSGQVVASISGEGETLGLTMAFEADGTGGWRVRFTGPGFDFTIP